MFDADNWTEIFNSIKQNRMRTFLTGFSISWGIFMFVIMLSISNGAHTGLKAVFEKRSSNIVQIQGRYTSIPFDGFPDNRKINFDNRNFNRLNNRFAETEFVSPLIPIDAKMSSGSYDTFGRCVGINTEYININGIKVFDKQGRLINDMDIREKRKVAIINERLSEVVFRNDNPVGKSMLINNIEFSIVGVYSENTIVDVEKAYIPFSTAQLLFYGGWGFHSLAFTLQDLYTTKDNELFNERLLNSLAEMHRYNPDDRVAVNLISQMKTYLQTLGIFNAIVIFIWVIGFGTLFAGMVGVSNIMLITVRERTREFGIRKAIGAKPSSILKGIIMESVFITSAFGYLGLFLGICASNLFRIFLIKNPDVKEFAIFDSPSLDISIAFAAMILLIIVGVFAGYFPARQAVKIMPIEAMREE